MTRCMFLLTPQRPGSGPPPPKNKKNVKETMKLTFHKWVFNVMTGPNPTQHTKFNKYMLKSMTHLFGIYKVI